MSMHSILDRCQIAWTCKNVGMDSLPEELRELIWDVYICGLRERMGRTIVVSQVDLWRAVADEMSLFEVAFHLNRMPGVRACRVDGVRRWEVTQRELGASAGVLGVKVRALFD